MRRSVQVLIASLLPVMAWAGPIDINKADAATIAKELQGIGLSRAQAIVAYREKNGAFKSADDLRKVKGIGAKTLERNRAEHPYGAATAEAARAVESARVRQLALAASATARGHALHGFSSRYHRRQAVSLRSIGYHSPPEHDGGVR